MFPCIPCMSHRLVSYYLFWTQLMNSTCLTCYLFNHSLCLPHDMSFDYVSWALCLLTTNASYFLSMHPYYPFVFHFREELNILKYYSKSTLQGETILEMFCKRGGKRWGGFELERWLWRFKSNSVGWNEQKWWMNTCTRWRWWTLFVGRPNIHCLPPLPLSVKARKCKYSLTASLVPGGGHRSWF